jgi:hypothetical protein
MDNQKPVKTSFWDFKNIKDYTTILEKRLDFWVGWLIPEYIISIFLTRIFSIRYEQLGEMGHKTLDLSFSKLLPTLIPLFAIFVIIILGIFYFLKRRKHLAYGLLVSLILSIMVFIFTLL